MNVLLPLQVKLQKQMELAFRTLEKQMAVIEQQNREQRKVELKELQQQFLEVLKVDVRQELAAQMEGFLKEMGTPSQELRIFADGINQKMDRLADGINQKMDRLNIGVDDLLDQSGAYT